MSQGFTYGCCLGSICWFKTIRSCNVRREDSPLGAGIIFHQSDNQVFKIEIDLRKEMPLRSDLKPTGRIKKERLQAVPLYLLGGLFRHL